MALVEETRRATVLVSVSGNHVVQHTEIEVRQQASFSSQDTQVSLERSAQTCSTRIYEATAEEGLEEGEVGLDEVRTEGYLLGSPGRDTRGFRDPLRSDDPNLPCLASSFPTLALPAPPGTVPLLLPPPPEPPTVPEVPQEGNRKRKARERDLLNEYAAEEPHESEGIPLLASQARPRGTAEPPIPPSRESSQPSQPS